MMMMMAMANKHAKFSAFVVVNASFIFILLLLSIGCCPSLLPLSLFIEHSEHVWPFSLLSAGGLFGRFSFLCVLCCLGLFSFFVVLLYGMH